MRVLNSAGVFAFVAGVLPAISASAQDVASFYAGKTITVVVGFSTGASYDSQARMLTKTWANHIPGKPTIVVQNMPGAGSKTAANYIYNISTKDGLAMGMFSRGMFLEALFDAPGVRFDPLKYNWIGSHTKEVSLVLASAKTPFKSIEDIRASEMTVGATGPGADTHAFPTLLNAVIGTKFKVVSGYPGNSEAFLAIDRGEVQGNSGSSIGSLAALRPNWLTEKGHIHMIAQLALRPHPKQLKGVPLIMDYAKTDLDRAVLRLAFSRQDMPYAVAAPPGIPADRLAALRQSFMETMRDSEFIADAQRLFTEIDVLTGDQVLDIIKTAYASSPEAIARAKAAVMPAGQVK